MQKTEPDTDYNGVDNQDDYSYTMNVCAKSTATYAQGDCGNNGGFVCQFDQTKATLVATVASVSASPVPNWTKIG